MQYLFQVCGTNAELNNNAGGQLEADGRAAEKLLITTLIQRRRPGSIDLTGMGDVPDPVHSFTKALTKINMYKIR